MWVFNEHVGQDERGGHVPSGMYRELWTNGPKECLEFPDFTFQECFGVAIPSFPSREVMLRYHKNLFFFTSLHIPNVFLPQRIYL